MSSQRYERIAEVDQDQPSSPAQERPPQSIPNSPPPSFHSRNSSPASRHFLTSEDPAASDEDRTLADTFDDGEDSDEEDRNGGDDRQRLMRATPSLPVEEQRIDNDEARQAVSQLPGSVLVAQGRPNLSPGVTIPNHLTSANDGVFANLNAKPERGEKLEEHPPTYEQAAADATPPYWETTILTPGRASDEVYVDGLPVGSLFSFFWNGMISMSFQLVGFLLTYLLHTTHAAKNGSKAGLGITMVQYGFLMRGGSSKSPDAVVDPTDPQFPNAHDFDPTQVADATTVAASSSAASSSSITSVASSEWLAYALMIVGWFILIRSVSDFLRARRHEQLVLQSPDRGLGLPVVAEGERSETAV